jgi:orotate phosphoribosyltransferase
MCAEGQFLIGKVCWDALQGSGHPVTHAGGLTMGADPIAYALAHRSWLEGKPLDAFSVRKKPKDHGTGQQIEGGLPPDARCLVIEDSMTTGSSALQAVDVLEHFGATVVAVLTLVDREEGARARIEKAGYPLISLVTASELLALAGPPR